MIQHRCMAKVNDFNGSILILKFSLFHLDGSTPRTPALSKRIINSVQQDNSDNTSIHSSNRPNTRRAMTIDTTDVGDSV